jgi:hypothetical protein
MSAPESIINITSGDAVLGLIVIFCLVAIWAAAGPPRPNKPHQHGNSKKD